MRFWKVTETDHVCSVLHYLPSVSSFSSFCSSRTVGVVEIGTDLIGVPLCDFGVLIATRLVHIVLNLNK